MAIAVILFATFLTLILVPVLYSVIDDLTDFFKRHYTHVEEVEVEEDESEVLEDAVDGEWAPVSPGGPVAEPRPATVRSQRVPDPLGPTGGLTPQPE